MKFKKIVKKVSISSILSFALISSNVLSLYASNLNKQNYDIEQKEGEEIPTDILEIDENMLNGVSEKTDLSNQQVEVVAELTAQITTERTGYSKNEKSYTNVKQTINSLKNKVDVSVISKDNLIKITPEMVKLESSIDGQGTLFDEQDQIQIDEKGQITGTPKSYWNAADDFFGIKKNIPFMAYVDLGKTYEISGSAIHHMQSSSKVEFSYGMPGEWTLFEKYAEGGNPHWSVSSNDTVKTRYIGIKFNMETGTNATRELLFFGKPVEGELSEFKAPEKIELKEDMMVNVTGHAVDSGNYDNKQTSVINWIDEQDKMSDFPTEKPETGFTLPWGGYDGTTIADIDLRKYYDLEKICFYDGDENSWGEFTLHVGDYKDWKKIFSVKTAQTGGWVYVDLKELKEDLNTRYIRIEKKGRNSSINEVILYGKATSDYINDAIIKEPVQMPKTEMDKLIGLNSFVWYQSPEIVGAGGTVRDYTELSLIPLKNTSENGLVNFNSFNMDEYYRRYNEAGVDVFPSLIGGIPYINNGIKPVKSGDSTTNPESYKEHASVLFQYGARYGNTKVSENLLKLSRNVVPKTGLDYIKYYENANEQDGKWRVEAFSAEEFAAMTSADYDGHEGSLGEGYGLKKADPNAKLVMGGTAGLYLDYIKGMDYWFQNNRKDKEFAADVINLHHYSGAKSPEDDNIYESYKEIVDYVNKNIPGREVWISEFGWDTYYSGSGDSSPVLAPDLESQANWMIRSYLIGSATGVDRMQMYMLPDVNSEVNSKYSTSGLIKDKRKDHERKTSWYYVNTARELLKNTTFESIIESDDVYVYKYSADDRDVYALWSPTSNGTTSNYNLNVGANEAVLTEMQDGETMGQSKVINSFNINVSERPAFVTVSKDNSVVLPPTSNLKADTYDGRQFVELAAEEGADIYFTTDYSIPTTESNKYEGPISINISGTIRAISVKNGKKSIVSTFSYMINDLNLDLENIEFEDNKVTPDFDKKYTDYKVSVDNSIDSTKVKLTAEDHIKIFMNGAEVKSGEFHNIDLKVGINKIPIEIEQTHTGNKKMYTLDITRKSNKDIKIIKPEGAGTAEGSGHFDLLALFDGDVKLNNDFYSPEITDKGKGFNTFANRAGFIDFGENWKDIRITGTWTQYANWSVGKMEPFNEVWWDEDNDNKNDSNLVENKLNFSTGTIEKGENVSKWIQDIEAFENPIKPQARYLMLKSNANSAGRATELVIVGYVSDGDDGNPTNPEPEIGEKDIINVSAGTAVGSNWTSFSSAFDGEIIYDKENEMPVVIKDNVDGSPILLDNTSAYIDFGEDWESVRINEVWSYYRGWSNLVGESINNMFWSANNNKAEPNNDVEDRFTLHSANVGNIGKETKWIDDAKFEEAIKPKNRYLMINIDKKIGVRAAEFAFVGYKVK